MQNYLSYSKQVTNWAIYCLQHYQSHEKCRNSIFCRLRSVSSCMRESAGRNVSIRSYNALTCGDMLCRATTSQSLRRPVPSGPANMTRQFQKLVRPKRGQSAQDPPWPCAHIRSKKIFPWETSPEEFQKSFLTKNLDVRTNKKDRVKLRKQGFQMVWVSHSWVQYSLTVTLQRFEFAVWAVFRDPFLQNFGTVQKNLTPWHTLGTQLWRTVGGLTRTKWEKSVPGG